MKLDPAKIYGTLIFKANNLVERGGIDQPDSTICKLAPNLIIIKCPGHSYWASRGRQGFAGTEFQAFKPLYRVTDNAVYCEELWHMPVRITPTEDTYRYLMTIPTKEQFENGNDPH